MASASAVGIASSICWPAAACSSGMGTANSRSLCRPKDRVPAVGQEKETGMIHYEAVAIHCTIDDNVRFKTPYSVLLSVYNDPD